MSSKSNPVDSRIGLLFIALSAAILVLLVLDTTDWIYKIIPVSLACVTIAVGFLVASKRWILI